ncbi:unnamed protein product [Lathyrus oleraceus]
MEHNLQMNIESRFSLPSFSTTTTSKIILCTTCHSHQEYDTPFIQKHLIFFTPTPKLSVYQPSFTYLHIHNTQNLTHPSSLAIYIPISTFSFSPTLFSFFPTLPISLHTSAT